MIKKIKIILLAFAILLGFSLIPKLALAATCSTGEAISSDTGKCAPVKRAIDCASGKLVAGDSTKCAPLGNGCNGNSAQTCLTNNPITTNLNNAIDFLSAGVGIVVIAVIIIGGIQYTLAGDNASATQAARQRITNGLIALFAFLFTFAFLQWLIPGGL
jgi:hypothetical protein